MINQATPPVTGSIDEQTLALVSEKARDAIQEVSAIFVGPSETVSMLFVALIARGHVLLEGVPGVAKTTLVKAFAQTLSCSFRRIQFTPDLLPSDITGTYVLSPKEGVFEMREGPIFANVVLGDEINRAPAKTQSALLEAMQESQVTIEGDTRPLPSPFIVLATQNPVEQTGTYPLPEAQIDRFLVRLIMGYPSAQHERDILKRFMGAVATPRVVLDPATILWMQDVVSRVHVEDEVIDYVIRLAAFTREHAHLMLGASPRASLALVQAARAKALLAGRSYVLPDDIKALAVPVLAHRLVLTPEAEMEGLRQDKVVRDALKQVPHRREAR